MATDTNSITISGNITRDPEMRYTPSGVSKVSFGVAVNRSWRNQQTQEWEEQTSFFNVVAWRQLAENASATAHEGHARRGQRPARTAQLGDGGGREALDRRGRRRRHRAVACGSRPPRSTRSSAVVPAMVGAAVSAAPRLRPQPRAAPVAAVAASYDQYGEEPF